MAQYRPKVSAHALRPSTRNGSNLEVSSDSSGAVKLAIRRSYRGLQHGAQPLMQLFLKAGDVDVKPKNLGCEWMLVG